MKIQEITQEIRAKALKRAKKRSPQELSTSWTQEDLLYSGTGRTIFMILPTPGCSWALSESGGCSMCSYIAESTLEPISAQVIIDIFHEMLEKYEIEETTAFKIFTSGSFLNPSELPPEARDEILKTLNGLENVAEIVVESRPEYVTPEVLRECCSLIPDKLFEVSMGLETSDDYTREFKINKGFSQADFEKAVNVIKDLKKEYDVKSKAYILVKPILTSEKEAIDQAIDTAIYGEKVGLDRVSFCPSTIHKGTLMEYLWRSGSYQPPQVWSVIEIINKVRQSIRIPAVMDTSGFGSRRGPYNCKKCNSKLKDMIIESNLNQTPVEDIECDCKGEWMAQTKFSDVNRSTTQLQYIKR
jgi:radical SAM enzyme (TIGR01210 family)